VTTPPDNGPPTGVGDQTPAPTGTPAVKDTRAPRITLGGAAAQRLLKTKAILISVRLDEIAKVQATASLNVPGAAKVFRLRSSTLNVAAQKQVTIKLKLPKKALAAVKRALARSKKVVASVKVTATDGAGNLSTVTRKIRAKR
jgi:hypothetical protein